MGITIGGSWMMKKSIGTWVWAALLGVGTSVPANGAAIENPDFEDGTLSGWSTQSQQLSFSVSTNDTFNRNYAARLAGAHSGATWVTNTLSQIVPVVAGDTVKTVGFAYWKSMSNSAGNAEAYLEAKLSGAPGVEATQRWTSVHNGWMFFELEGTYPGVANGGFESGRIQPWTVGADNLTVALSHDTAYNGDYSLRFEGEWTGWSWNQSIQIFTLQAGDTLKGRARVNAASLTKTDPTGWAVAGIKLEQEGGPDNWEAAIHASTNNTGWVDLQFTASITNSGTYVFRCMVAGQAASGSIDADIYFDDVRFWKDAGGYGETADVTLSLTYAGTAGGNNEQSDVDIYFDTITLDGSSASPDTIDDIHSLLISNASAVVNGSGEIPPLDYPPLFAEGYPGGDTNEVNYAAHVESAVSGWRFRHLTNNAVLKMTNTVVVYELGGSGPGYIEIDQYMYCARNWGTERGDPLDIVTNAPYWTLGSVDGGSTEFGDGPFLAEHTYVVGTPLSNFPRRLVTSHDGTWPDTLKVVFDENLGQFDRTYDKHFVLWSVTTNGADSNVKAMKSMLDANDPGNTNFSFTSFEIHMGWADDDETAGKIDYPNVTYQGHNEVFLRSGYLYGILDREGWFAQPVARGSATIEPIALYGRENGSWNFKPYEEYLYAWPNAASGVRSIFEDDTVDRVPGPVSYNVGYKIGHQYGTNEFGEPQFPGVIEIRGNGYFRMTDYGGVMGGSLRPVSQDIFGIHQYIEDAPLMPEAYAALISRSTPTNGFDDSYMRMFIPVRSKKNEALTGVVQVDAFFAPDQVEDDGTYIEMETDVFANEDITTEDDGPLNIFAQVNMYWRGGESINGGFEGHDHDTIKVKKSNGEWITHRSLNPPTNVVHRKLSSLASNDVVYILQTDRGASSYGFATEAPYRRVSNFEFTILDDGGRELALDIFEQNTISEINDNVVVACSVRDDIDQGEQVHSKVRYRTTYAPGITIASPSTSDGGENWGDNEYTIEVFATDGDDQDLKVDLYYGNGLDGNWTLINQSETLLVPTNTHKVTYDWNVSGVTPGAYYIRAEAERVAGGKRGFDVSFSRLQVGPTHGFPNNGTTNITVVTNAFGYLGTNMSFETGDVSGWASGGDHLNIYVDDEKTYAGDYAARMEGNWTGWSWNNIQQEIPCSEGESLRVQGRVFIGSLAKGGTNWLKCGIKMESTNHVGRTSAGQEFDAAVHGTGTWLHVDFNRIVPVSGTDRLLLWVAGHDADSADVYFDAIEVTSTNTGAVVTNTMRNGYWEGDAVVDVTDTDVLGFQVASDGNASNITVWVADNTGVTNSVQLTNYLDRAVSLFRSVSVPWSDFASVDKTKIISLGFDSEGELDARAVRAAPEPLRVSVALAGAPMSDGEGMPHFNPGEPVTQVVTIANNTTSSMNGMNVQLLQEYGETTYWTDSSPHVDPLQSERTRKADRLAGDFETVWTGVNIPASGSVVLTNVYVVPVGRLIDHTQIAIPSSEDWYIYRNFDARAQVRLVVRESDGDNVYENEQVASYSMDNDNDIDNDGLSDGWETEYGTNETSMNPGDDPDGDGYTNLEEFEANTDPNNANSYPGMTPIEVNLVNADGTAYLGGENSLTIAYNTQGSARWLRYGIKAKGGLLFRDNFEAGGLTGWTIASDPNIAWSNNAGVLEASVIGTGGYAYIYRDDVVTGVTNFTIEYSVKYEDGAALGGFVFGDEVLHVNPTTIGWHGQTSYATMLTTGLWHNVIVHVRDASPNPLSDLYVDDAAVFINEVVPTTNWTGAADIGWLSPYYSGYVQWDDVRVSDELFSIASVSVNGSNSATRFVSIPDRDALVPGLAAMSEGEVYEWAAYLNGSGTQVVEDVTVVSAPELAIDESAFPILAEIGGTVSVPVVWSGAPASGHSLRVWLENADDNVVAATQVVAVSGMSSTGEWVSMAVPAATPAGTNYFWAVTLYPTGNNWWTNRLGHDDTYRFDNAGEGHGAEVPVEADARLDVFNDNGMPAGSYNATWNGGSATFDANYTGGTPPEGSESYLIAGASWAGMGIFKSSGTENLSLYSNGWLRFSVKSTDQLKIELEGPTGNKQIKYIPSSGGAWTNVVLDLDSDFNQIDLGQVKGYFMITSDVAATSQIDNVRWSLSQ